MILRTKRVSHFLLQLRMGLFCLAAASSSVVMAAGKDASALFSWGDKSYPLSEFTDGLQQAAYQIEIERFNKMQHMAESMLIELHLQEEAKKLGINLETAAQIVFATVPPSEDAIKAFYEENKANIPQPLEQVKGQIVNYLQSRNIDEKRQSLLVELKAQKPFKFFLVEPVAPVMSINTEGYPFSGATNAKVTLVIFADYQCPHCKQESIELKKLMSKYSDKVKLVYRDFPINKSGISTKVAEGAECAFQQKKFWEYHDMAFELQAGLSKDTPLDFAEVLELDLETFKKCLSDPATAARVEASKGEAVAINVTSTPTVFINGLKVAHSHGTNALEDAIKAALAK